MVKAFSVVILLFLLTPVDLSFAQTDPGGIKIYSGSLHQFSVKSKAPFWHVFFSKSFPKQEEVVPGWKCSVEFKSPTPFSHQSVTQVPDQLTYVISCQNAGTLSYGDPVKEMEAFQKFVINIYTNDDQEYSIDSQAEGRQIGPSDEHHISDAYIIYLLLGNNIDHLEIVSSSPDVKDKYILDKFEIHDNH